MNNTKIEMPLEKFLEIQKFILFIYGFIWANEKIDHKSREKILNKINELDEIFGDIIL